MPFRRFSRPLAIILAATGIAFSALSAETTGDREAGWHLAARWCSHCHLIDAAGHGTDVAPAFPAIAREHRGDKRWLRAWLSAPHPPMPNLNLSRGEIDDLVAYLESLTRL